MHTPRAAPAPRRLRPDVLAATPPRPAVGQPRRLAGKKTVHYAADHGHGVRVLAGLARILFLFPPNYDDHLLILLYHIIDIELLILFMLLSH